MLHKSFTATLSNSTDAHTSPYPLSFSPPPSLPLYSYWPPVARDNSFMHLWRTIFTVRDDPRSSKARFQISKQIVEVKNPFPLFENLWICPINQWKRITRFNFQFKLSLEGLVNFFDAHLSQLLISLIKSPLERMSRMFSKSPIRVTSVSIRPTTTTRPNKRRHNSSH